jgi:PadR family transcriptional regulator, regulatory protein PadR
MTDGNRDNGRYNPANEAWSKNWLMPVLLLMLRQWRSSGYELMEKMSTFGLAARNPGTCCRTLRQMERAGMVSSRWDTSKGGPARLVYSITEAGEAYLNHWAQSLDQYQRVTDIFFQLYTGQLTKREKKDQG